ncbi:hypothetical protein [Nonomuraea sp. NPDC002799]
MNEPQTEDPMIAALLRERDGYVLRDMADRVAQVDEQLSLRGYTPPDDAPRPGAAPERATPPRGRRSPRKDTT